MLLNSDIFRNDIGQLSIEAALFQISVKKSLEFLVKVGISRAGVKALAKPVLLRSLGFGEIGPGKMGDFVDLEKTILDGGLDEEGAAARFFNVDVDASREARYRLVIEFPVGRCNAVFGAGGDRFTGLTLIYGLLVVSL